MKATIGWIAFAALVVACGSSERHIEDYPQYLPPETSGPIVPDTPRAVVPRGYVPRTAGAAPARRPTGTATTCEEFCALAVGACASHVSGLLADRGACVQACRTWRPGVAGADTTDTLACRMTHARRALEDPGRSCWDAAVSSAPCLLGRYHVEAPPLRRQQRTILGLYDSTDARAWAGGRRAKRVVLDRRVRKALKGMGHRLVLHDVSRGLPSDFVTGASRGIVTSFYDAEMVGARQYVGWLRAQVEAGRRVLILNDFGAFRERGGAWLSDDLVNLVFEGLGVRYGGDWTDRGDLLSIVRADDAAFRRLPDPRRASHYYRFEPRASDVRVHLGLARRDRPGPMSAVVMSSPRGGLALTRYYETARGRQNVDLSRLLKVSLGL